jgi:hypothetical protein
LDEEPPPYQLKRLRAQRARYLSEFLRIDVIGLKICPGVSRRIGRDLAAALKLTPRYADAVERTLGPRFAGKELTERMCRVAAAYLAGNHSKLAAGKPVRPWNGVEPVWAPVEVADVYRHATNPKMYHLKLLSMAGPSAGCVVPQIVSDGFLRFMLREVGFPRYGKFDCLEAMRVVFVCAMEVVKGRLMATTFKAPAPFKRHNRMLHAVRHGGCPRKRNTECAKCPAGLDICHGAVRIRTVEWGQCANGHRGQLAKGQTICEECRRNKKER